MDSIRGLRYFGPSKMSLYNLAIHSFSIIAVFKNIVFFRSVIFLIILSFLSQITGYTFIFLQIIIVFFNIIIFLVSQRESESELLNSNEDIHSENIH